MKKYSLFFILLVFILILYAGCYGIIGDPVDDDDDDNHQSSLSSGSSVAGISSSSSLMIPASSSSLLLSSQSSSMTSTLLSSSISSQQVSSSSSISVSISLSSFASVSSVGANEYVADYRIAKESVLRSIPESYLTTIRNSLIIAYQHTSHGTHVSYGLYGLPDFEAGDDTYFGIVRNGTATDKLAFYDYAFSGYGSYSDLSTADANWPGFVDQVRAYLDDTVNADINVVMWSWCDISGHSAEDYCASMQTLIDEYGDGGSKIGTDTGQTRTTPVTFVFMTGHATTSNNTGTTRPGPLAQTIIDYCHTHGYFCLDYYSIDTHDMDDNYWEDAGDNGNSAAYDTANGDTGTNNFYQDWQDAHDLSSDWYENKTTPGGSVAYGQHNTQHITANRKAFAMWWILARIAGWDGVSGS